MYNMPSPVTQVHRSGGLNVRQTTSATISTCHTFETTALSHCPCVVNMPLSAQLSPDTRRPTCAKNDFDKLPYVRTIDSTVEANNVLKVLSPNHLCRRCHMTCRLKEDQTRSAVLRKSAEAATRKEHAAFPSSRRERES